MESQMAPAPLPASITDRDPFVPAAYLKPDGSADPTAPVYLVRIASTLDQEKWRREIMRTGAKPVGDDELRESLIEAAKELLEEPTRAEVLDALDTMQDLVRKAAETPPSDDEQLAFRESAAVVAEFERAASRDWQGYANLIADKAYWWNVARVVAASFFLDGHTTVADEGYARVELYPRGRDGRVKEEALQKVLANDRFEIGSRAMVLMSPTTAQKKS